MITVCNDDVLDARAPVIPVNLVGAMGKGLALQARNRWPQIYSFYRASLADRTLGDIARSGTARDTPVTAKLAFWRTTDGQAVILAPTKRHWRDRSPLELVAGAVNAIPRTLDEIGTQAVNMPPIGCGLGGLAHRDVLAMIADAERRRPGIEWVLHRWPQALTASFKPHRG